VAAWVWHSASAMCHEREKREIESAGATDR
jgi:hypothetical protein